MPSASSTHILALENSDTDHSESSLDSLGGPARQLEDATAKGEHPRASDDLSESIVTLRDRTASPNRIPIGIIDPVRVAPRTALDSDSLGMELVRVTRDWRNRIPRERERSIFHGFSEGDR